MAKSYIPDLDPAERCDLRYSLAGDQSILPDGPGGLRRLPSFRHFLSHEERLVFLGKVSRVLIGAAALTIPLFGSQVVGASAVSATPAPTQARWQCDYESCGGI